VCAEPTDVAAPAPPCTILADDAKRPRLPRKRAARAKAGPSGRSLAAGAVTLRDRYSVSRCRSRSHRYSKPGVCGRLIISAASLLDTWHLRTRELFEGAQAERLKIYSRASLPFEATIAVRHRNRPHLQTTQRGVTRRGSRFSEGAAAIVDRVAGAVKCRR
jgi:hypothetical protein